MEATMKHHNNAILSFGDIMSILLVCMVLVCILMSAKVVQEQYASVNLETHQAKENQTESPGANTLFLTITKEGTYVFEGSGIQAAQPITTHALALERLKNIMPAKLFLRADRQVDFGKVHQIFNDATDNSIPVALAAKLP
jgi:biopolymer transport protein ExbD